MSRTMEYFCGETGESWDVEVEDCGYDPIAFVGPCHEAMYGLVAAAQDCLETIKAQADNLAYDVEHGFHLSTIPF